jgi:hypothetical protein
MIDIHSSYIHITATQGSSTWGSEGAFSQGLVGFGWAMPFTLFDLWRGDLPSVIIGGIWKTQKRLERPKIVFFSIFLCPYFRLPFPYNPKMQKPTKKNLVNGISHFFSLLSLLPRDMSNNSFKFHLFSISWI